MKKLRMITFIAILAFGISACQANPVTNQQLHLARTQQNEVQPMSSIQTTGPETAESSSNQPAEQTQNSNSTLPETKDGLTYPIVDTNQGLCYDDKSSQNCPSASESFYGQDAQYQGNTPGYTDNGDGTVTDLVTGLMWQQDPGEKKTYTQAVADAESFSLAGYDDWRLPTIKELYSLILFDGTDISGCNGSDCSSIPFIDQSYFDFEYGDTSAGERIIDSQWATSTKYVSTTMNGSATMFGVNFADGRIKGYGYDANFGKEEKTFFTIYVHGNPDYGTNDFVDNQDGTISDLATGLTWEQTDSGTGFNWAESLEYCEGLTNAGYDDWRLPNAKELHSIVDYSRSPDTTQSAAINPLFQTTAITNENGQTDYPAYWTSTTHATSNGMDSAGVYISFGRAMGYMNGQWIDVHGAGAQRSDPKSGDPSQYETGHGPQGDAVRINNYIRCVRGGTAALDTDGDSSGSRSALTNENSSNSTGTGINNSGSQQLAGTPGLSGQNQPGQPPQAAFAACANKTTGETCQFTGPVGTITGTCRQIGQLVCVPNQGPPPQQAP